MNNSWQTNYIRSLKSKVLTIVYDFLWGHWFIEWRNLERIACTRRQEINPRSGLIAWRGFALHMSHIGKSHHLILADYSQDFTWESRRFVRQGHQVQSRCAFRWKLGVIEVTVLERPKASWAVFTDRMPLVALYMHILTLMIVHSMNRILLWSS